MDAIEGRNKVKTRVGRQAVNRGVVEVKIFQARPLLILLRSCESMPANLLPMKRRLREGFCHLDKRGPGPATDIRGFGPGLQLTHNTVESRQHL